MTNQDRIESGRRSIEFSRHLQHGWRRSPFLLTVAMRMKRRNYSSTVNASPTALDDALPEQQNN